MPTIEAAIKPHKFKNPANPSQTWSGFGVRPRWVIEALASGKTLDDLTHEKVYIPPELFGLYADCIRGGQIPEHDVVSLLSHNKDFKAWYLERLRC